MGDETSVQYPSMRCQTQHGLNGRFATNWHTPDQKR